MNEKHYDYIPMMINFYSLNCKVNVAQSYNDENGISKEEYTKVFDHLSQDVIDPSNVRYDNEQLEYRINVIEKDTSQYEGELCKLFASAIELSDKHEENSRDILIPDNIPQPESTAPAHQPGPVSEECPPPSTACQNILLYPFCGHSISTRSCTSITWKPCSISSAAVTPAPSVSLPVNVPS